MQPFGKVFEIGLIDRLRRVFHYCVETDARMDREEKVDFTVSGNALPMPIEVQVTLQSDDGDKLKMFLRSAWFRKSAAPKLYVIFTGSINGAIAAHAIHRALCELAGRIEQNRSYALCVDKDGVGIFHDPKILARDLILQSRAKTANSLRRRGKVVKVEGGLVTIERDGKPFVAPLSSVVKGRSNRFKERKKIEKKELFGDMFVTFLPVAKGRADAVRIGKKTARRQREEIGG